MAKSAEVQITGFPGASTEPPFYSPIPIGNELDTAFARLGGILSSWQKEYMDDIKDARRAELLAKAREHLGTVTTGLEQQDPAQVIVGGMETVKKAAQDFYNALGASDRGLIADRFPLLATDAALQVQQSAFRRQDVVMRRNFDIKMSDYVTAGPSMSPEELVLADGDLVRAAEAMRRAEPGVDYAGLVQNTRMRVARARQANAFGAELAAAADSPALLSKIRQASKDLTTLQSVYGDMLTEQHVKQARVAVEVIEARTTAEAKRLSRLEAQETRQAVAGARLEISNYADRRGALAAQAMQQVGLLAGQFSALTDTALKTVSESPLTPLNDSGVYVVAQQLMKSLDDAQQYDFKPHPPDRVLPEVIAEVAESSVSDTAKALALAVIAHESAGGRKLEGDSGLAKGPGHVHPEVAKVYGTDAVGVANYLQDLLDKHRGNERLALAEYHWGAGDMDNWLAGRGTKLRRGGADVVLNASAMDQETEGYIASIGRSFGRDSKPIRQAVEQKLSVLEGVRQAQEAFKNNPSSEWLEQQAIQADEQYRPGWLHVLQAVRKHEKELVGSIIPEIGSREFARIFELSGRKIFAAHRDAFLQNLEQPGDNMTLAIVGSQPWREASGPAVRQALGEAIFELPASKRNHPTVQTALGALFSPSTSFDTMQAIQEGLQMMRSPTGKLPNAEALAGSSYYSKLMALENENDKFGLPRFGIGPAMVRAVTALWMARGEERNEEGNVRVGAWDKAAEELLEDFDVRTVGGRVTLWAERLNLFREDARVYNLANYFSSKRPDAAELKDMLSGTPAFSGDGDPYQALVRLATPVYVGGRTYVFGAKSSSAVVRDTEGKVLYMRVP